MNDTDALRALAAGLAARARDGAQRLTLVLAGDARWSAAATRAAAAALAPGPACWLSDRPLHPEVRPLDTATRLLGGECDLLVYDAWSGFDPDGFGAAVGTLCGGGLLLLPCPPLADWPDRTDPQAARIAPWPLDAAAVGARFIARLVRVLRDAPGVVIAAQGEPLPAPATAPPPPPTTAPPPPVAPDPARAATPDQAAAVAAILTLARGPGRRPLVLTAHRGRGKSAALGLAAGGLLGGAGASADAPAAIPDLPQISVAPAERALFGPPTLVGTSRKRQEIDRVRRVCREVEFGMAGAPDASRAGASPSDPRLVLVTAPRRAATEALFRHAARAWPGARSTPAGLADPRGELRFAAPDALAAEGPPALLLLVDEAAGIPAPLLTRLLERYPRIVFATTVHGYEGTGRGFDLRFRATLDQRTPGWRALTLGTPIRYAAGDPLEDLTFRALLLDAAPAAVTDPGSLDPGAWPLERLDREALAADDTGLRQVFGLLVLAHYQTRPLDLRLLLDAPGVRVLVLRQGGLIAATLIAVTEGGLHDPDLIGAVYAGARRPRGHLLPFTLSAHAGLPDAPGRRFLRVIRIAVHPALTGRGLGRRLLRGLAEQAAREGIGLLGSSFGATPGLLHFWTRCGFRPVQLGASRNAASGEHALVVLRATGAADRGWRTAATARFADRLAVLLPGPLRALEPALVAALLGALPPLRGSADSEALEALELASFATGHRTLEAALPALAALARRRLGRALRTRRISPAEAALLAAAAAQLRSVEELVPLFRARGARALTDTLRDSVGRLLPAPGGRPDRSGD